ncbi:MAG TPA: type VI secretion system tube protein TssD [Candidatus Dormibacteraeota bacterium]
MTRSLVVSRIRFLALVLVALLLALVAWQLTSVRTGAPNAQAAVGVTINMTVTGQKQGVFKGDDNSTSRVAGLITVTAYQFEVLTPRDPSTGQATGRRQYKPVVVTHVMGGSSPQFLDAAATNENLRSVVINFNRTDRFGRNVNYYRVTLTNASVSDVRQYTSGADVLEDDSLTFQKIEQQDLIAHTDFVDTFSEIT